MANDRHGVADYRHSHGEKSRCPPADKFRIWNLPRVIDPSNVSVITHSVLTTAPELRSSSHERNLELHQVGVGFRRWMQ